MSESAMNAEYLVVLCTCPTAGSAQAISTALLEEQLAACVNRVSGVRSMYRWAGKIEHDDEVLLVIKTATQHFDRLESTIRSLHPADVPEIIGLPIVAGSGDYLDWLGDSLT
jgi:periplasmic divalent cation tolerance protein